MSDHAKIAAAAYLTSSMGMSLPGISVTELTTLVQLHLKDFFDSVIDVHSRLYTGQPLAELVPVKQAFVVTTIVHTKWRAFSRDLFPNGFCGATANDGEAGVQLSFELGWWLYALAKCHDAEGTSQLSPLPAYHLLAAVVHLLLAHIPEGAMTATHFWPRLELSQVSVVNPVYPLPPVAQELLWTHLKTVPAELTKQQPTVTALLNDVAILFDLGGVSSEGALTLAGGLKLRALLAPTALAGTVAVVRTRYEVLWRKKLHLDDGYFLQPQSSPAHHPNASVPASPCRPPLHTTLLPVASPGGSSGGGGRCGDCGAPASSARHVGLLTPLRGNNPISRMAPPLPQTPMSSQLDAVGWLTKAVPSVSNAAAGPTCGLAKFYIACASGSPKIEVEARLTRLFELARSALLDNVKGPGLSSYAVEEQLELSQVAATPSTCRLRSTPRFAGRVSLAHQCAFPLSPQRLYYKMLLSFLTAEEKRLQKVDFSDLLANEAFHTSLLACCLESVFATYQTNGMAFPEVLHLLSLQPFDFGKVIESFIKHEPHLPAHLKLHFAEVSRTMGTRRVVSLLPGLLLWLAELNLLSAARSSQRSSRVSHGVRARLCTG